MSRRILYIQFGDAAAYPPLEHSTEILAERGWDVILIGTDAFNDQKVQLPPHSKIRKKNLSLTKAGSPLGLEYIAFFLTALYWTWVWRPAWIYASDPITLPALWVLRKLTNVQMVYHEHDAPNYQASRSRFMRIVLACRESLGREVELCVLPQRERLSEFLRATGRKLPTFCVWNSPRIGEIHENNTDQDNPLIMYYHGSINRARVPAELIVAACRFNGAVRVKIAGYESPGSIGYVQELTDLAEANGAPGLVEYLGTIPLRKDLLRFASQAHVGLSLMPKSSDDINLRNMVGASNKPFDCMACELPLLVTDLPEWVATFVRPGYARACDPASVDSIEAELRWYLEHPNKRREMGHLCVEKIRCEWNYDTAFAQVQAAIEGR